MEKVITIRAFADNYIYLFKYQQGCAVAVDPGDSKKVLSALKKENLELKSILLTHRHFDHTEGVKKLKKKTGCTVISSNKKQIASTDREVSAGDVLNFGSEKVRVISTPGHTSKSVCYYLEPSDGQSGAVFTGDTLFIGGCGRVFEADTKTMYTSLMSLAQLPDDTVVYPGHDYTMENYQFARMFDPETEKPQMPSTIGYEKRANIFMRADSEIVKKALKMTGSKDYEVFDELRRRKDSF